MRVLSIVAVAAAFTFRSFTAAAESPPPPWEIALGLDVGAPAGFVKVGEHNGPATLLHLHSDLGIHAFETLRAGATYHLTPHDEKSGEDNNEILFLGNGFGLTLAYRF